MLQKRYYFQCFCRGCADPTLDKHLNAVCCSSKSCPGCILMDPYTFQSDCCSKCGATHPNDLIQDVKFALQKGREVHASVMESKKVDGNYCYSL